MTPARLLNIRQCTEVRRKIQRQTNKAAVEIVDETQIQPHSCGDLNAISILSS